MKWISKKERLPERVTDCIVTVYKKGVVHNNVIMALFDGDQRFYEYQNDDDIDDLVTHWQPLPIPAEQN